MEIQDQTKQGKKEEKTPKVVAFKILQEAKWLFEHLHFLSRLTFLTDSKDPADDEVEMEWI